MNCGNTIRLKSNSATIGRRLNVPGLVIEYQYDDGGKYAYGLQEGDNVSNLIKLAFLRPSTVAVLIRRETDEEKAV